MKILLVAQSALAGLQLLVAGTTLEGAGLPHGYAALLVGLVAAAQLALSTYQHGAVKGSESVVEAPTDGSAGVGVDKGV